jgi:exodeoxyribonuclease VII large subunit
MKEEHLYEEDARVLSPTAVNSLIRTMIESEPDLHDVWVEGEVFDLKSHPSGHIYFSLKDSESVLRCTFFKWANLSLRIRLENGKKIRAFGSVSVYTKGGSYQLNIIRVAEAGKGDIHERLRRLYEKLKKEGLFDKDRKKPLPVAPVTLGVATAATGAAIRDIIQVARSRFPDINIVLAPCIVQGEEALTSVPAAIEALHDPRWNVDVIIAGRGGGSFEDLLPFNEEPIVRAFANARLPIVAAVGHQIDHPLCELAADAVAATPSNAAEMCVPVVADLLYSMDLQVNRIHRNLRQRLDRSRESLRLITNSRIYRNPLSILDPFQYRLDQTISELHALSRSIHEALRLRVKSSERMALLMTRALEKEKHRLALLANQLETLSPHATLKRGYAIVTDDAGRIVRSAKEAKIGSTVHVRLSQGSIGARVETVGE